MKQKYNTKSRYDLEDINHGKIKFDFKNLNKKGGVSWWTRFFLRIWPLKGIKLLTRELGLDSRHMEKANDLFLDVEQVDIIPLKFGERGFQIILDKSTALYFYQNGNHFVYDGSEVGEYDKGDVTIFDDAK